MNEHKSCRCTQTRPVCTQDSFHNCIPDPVVDGLPVGTADEELVLRTERRQMVARCERRDKTGRKLAEDGSVVIFMLAEEISQGYVKFRGEMVYK